MTVDDSSDTDYCTVGIMVVMDFNINCNRKSSKVAEVYDSSGRRSCGGEGSRGAGNSSCGVSSIQLW